MTLQNAPPGLDYERDKRFSKVNFQKKKTLLWQNISYDLYIRCVTFFVVF